MKRNLTLREVWGLAIFSWLLAISAIVILLVGVLYGVEIRKKTTVVWEKIYFIDLAGVKEEAKVEVEEIEEEPIVQYVIDATPSDIDLMARVVMSESSILSAEGKRAVAETIVNRVLSEDFPNTISEVIFQPNAYSTHWNGSPTAECYEAVRLALENPAYPSEMVYICSSGYHSCGYPYMRIGDMFFATTKDVTTYQGEEIIKD